MKIKQLSTQMGLRFKTVLISLATRLIRRLSKENHDPLLCAECGSRSITQRVWADPNTEEIVEWDGSDIDDGWCEECESHTQQVLQSELLFRAGELWCEADFRLMERLSGYRQSDFDPEEGSVAFVDACDEWWKRKSPKERIRIYLDNNS